MKPGDRKQRWKRSHNTTGVVLLAGFAMMAFGVDPPAGPILAIWMLVMAIFEFRDAQRGWKMRNDLPPWAHRQMNHPNPVIRSVARDAAKAVEEQKSLKEIT